MEHIELIEEADINEFQDQLDIPKYLYAPIYVRNLKEIKENGLTPEISNLSWNENLKDFIFLTSDREYAGNLALSSNKVNANLKESVFLLQIDSSSLNVNNVFIYNQNENLNETVFVHHGTLPYSVVDIAFSFG